MKKSRSLKPFDKVIVRSGDSCKWDVDFYSYYDEEKEAHRCVGFGWAYNTQILPYEGNENLVGTDLPVEEEVRLEKGECIVYNVLGNINSNSVNEYALGVFVSIDKTSSIGCATIKINYGIRQVGFFIKFSDFHPNNMEETKKNILCVRNGKIVKYKYVSS